MTVPRSESPSPAAWTAFIVPALVVMGILGVVGYLVALLPFPDANDAADRVELEKSAAEPAKNPDVPATNPAEFLDVRKALAEPALLDRIVLMSAQEAIERLNGMEYEGTVQHRMFVEGRPETGGKEKQTLVAHGDGRSALRVETNDNLAFELIHADGLVFIRQGGEPFRRSLPSGETPFYREKAWGTLARFWRHLRGFATFREGGTEIHEGRECLRLNLVALPNGAPAPTDAPLFTGATRSQYMLQLKSADAMVNRTRRRITEVRGVEGHILVDLKTGVPLRGQVKGAWVMPVHEDEAAKLRAAQGDNPAARDGREWLVVGSDIDFTVRDIGKPSPVNRPEVKAPEERRRLDTNPTGFLGEEAEKMREKSLGPSLPPGAMPGPGRPVGPSPVPAPAPAVPPAPGGER